MRAFVVFGRPQHNPRRAVLTQPVDRLAVLVGAFNLVCAAAEAQPVLALVDDAHWLDAASAEAIAFAARRIAADRVALLIATRSKGYADLPSISPQPLTAEQARELLEERGLVADAVQHTVSVAAGNPPTFFRRHPSCGSRELPTGLARDPVPFVPTVRTR